MNQEEAKMAIRKKDNEIFDLQRLTEKTIKDLREEQLKICQNNGLHKSAFHTGPGDFCGTCGQEI